MVAWPFPVLRSDLLIVIRSPENPGNSSFSQAARKAYWFGVCPLLRVHEYCGWRSLPTDEAKKSDSCLVSESPSLLPPTGGLCRCPFRLLMLDRHGGAVYAHRGVGLGVRGGDPNRDSMFPSQWNCSASAPTRSKSVCASFDRSGRLLLNLRGGSGRERSNLQGRG